MRKDGVLSYILGDHLGSTSIVTDASGNLISQTKYKAWGEVRYESGASPTEYQFTSQYSHAGEFGLLFYNARFYDPALGRFVSPDTIIPNNQGVQAWDRYAYVNNNPIAYNDPTGQCLNCVLIIGAFAAIATTAIYVFDPNTHAAIDNMAKAIVSGLERQQRTEAENREKLIVAMEATFGQSGDDQNGPNFEQCTKSIGTAIGCTLLAVGVVGIGLKLLTTGGCGEDESLCPSQNEPEPDLSTPTSTPTSTPMSTPTSTPTSTTTSTPTSTATPTPTSTPTSTPRIKYITQRSWLFAAR
jgi:RHS repeat-associated protein